MYMYTNNFICCIINITFNFIQYTYKHHITSYMYAYNYDMLMLVLVIMNNIRK